MRGRLAAVAGRSVVAALTEDFKPLPPKVFFEADGWAFDRPREITDLPEELLERLARSLEVKEIRVCLIMPTEFEARIAGAVFKSLGDKIFSVRMLYCKTRIVKNTLYFRFYKAETEKGVEELNLWLPVCEVDHSIRMVL